MAYGYETMVTRGFTHAANQNGIFAHGQDLLYQLRRRREGHSPIIFIAHSLAGNILKGMLTHAKNIRGPNFIDILEKITAVVFLSTPHQGSEHAQLGEIARRIASAFELDINEALLDSLGLRNDNPRRAQRLFGTIWLERMFRLKTFKETKALVRFNMGKLNELVSLSLLCVP